MMHCHVKRQLSAYLDDELTTDEANHIRIHLGRCVKCRHRFREIQAAESLLRRMPTSLIPDQWSFAAEMRLRSAAGLSPTLLSDPANGMAFRAAAATLSMAVMLFMVTVGPLAISRPRATLVDRDAGQRRTRIIDSRIAVRTRGRLGSELSPRAAASSQALTKQASIRH